MTIACKDCKFLIIERCPTYPVHYNYLCGAAIEDKEYMDKFKRENDGLDINYIGKVLGEGGNAAPDWCPCKEGFISEEECRIVVDENKICEVKDGSAVKTI